MTNILHFKSHAAILNSYCAIHWLTADC